MTPDELRRYKREAERRYRLANPEKYRARDRARNQTPERHEYTKEYNRRYYEENAERIRATVAAYRDGNPDKVKAVKDRWYAADPDRGVRLAQRRRARKKQAFVQDISRSEICERDGWICGICGEPVPEVAYPDPLSPSIDHIIPLDKGGLHEPKNVQLAHLRCNLRKGTKVEQGEEVNSA